MTWYAKYLASLDAGKDRKSFGKIVVAYRSRLVQATLPGQTVQGLTVQRDAPPGCGGRTQAAWTMSSWIAMS
jgi:hypothetical protein